MPSINFLQSPLAKLFLVFFISVQPALGGELLKDAPTTANEHELIEITASADASSYAWIVRKSDGHRPRIRAIDNGKTILWTSAPGNFQIDVICLSDGVLQQDFTEFEIKSKAPAPQPPTEPPSVPPSEPKPPTSPESPIPPGTSEVAKQSRQWAKEIGDAQTALSIAQVFMQIADALGDGTLNIDSGLTVLGKSLDELLGGLGTASKWEGYRGKVNELITNARQKGDVSSGTDLANTLRQLGFGLELSADGVAIQSADMAKILGVVVIVNKYIDEGK